MIASVLVLIFFRNIVYLEDKSIRVEIADSLSELQKGLMFRESLCEECGMLFVFEDPGRHGFWMKNTLIPLDIVFIDEKFMIVNVSMAVPCEEKICKTYDSISPAKYALEVNAGNFDMKDLGKFVEIRNVRLGSL